MSEKVTHGTVNTDSNCVEDVRRIREQLSRECADDIQRLADRARHAAEPYIKQLGLIRAEPPQDHHTDH